MGNSVDVRRIGEGRYSLDVRGHVCPYPELLTLRALHGLYSKDILEVVLDNPPSVRDIPATLKKGGYAVLDVLSVDKGTWKIIVQSG